MNKWWGYLHDNGSIQAKRYFDRLDLVEAESSDFVSKVCPPFEARNREDALAHLRGFFDGIRG